MKILSEMVLQGTALDPRVKPGDDEGAVANNVMPASRLGLLQI